MTRDEVAGLALPAPERARPDVPEPGDTDDGEGGSVSTELRDVASAVDVPVEDESDDGTEPDDGTAMSDQVTQAIDIEAAADAGRSADASADAEPDATGEPLAESAPEGDAAPADQRSALGSGSSEELAATHVVRDVPAGPSPSELRVDFGAHLEANYQRLVAQMYAITLSTDQAHGVVQDAYSRAWRNWAVIGRSADPTGWVRRIAVRTTMRSWRNVLTRFGLVRAAPRVAEGFDERATALLTALRELPAPERRSVVLFHMAGLSPGEIAAVEQVTPNTITTRLDRARRAVLGDDGDLLTAVIELPDGILDEDRGYVEEMMTPISARDQQDDHLDDRWDRSDAWTGGPDGSWIVAEASPWDTASTGEWPYADLDERWADAALPIGGAEPGLGDADHRGNGGSQAARDDDGSVQDEDVPTLDPGPAPGGDDPSAANDTIATPRDDSEDDR